MRLLILALSLTAGCAPTALGRAIQTVTAADQVVLVGEQAFVPWDKAHQEAIVQAAKAANRDPAPEVASYEVARKKVVLAFHEFRDAETVARGALQVAAQGSGANVSSIVAPIELSVCGAAKALSDASGPSGFTFPGLPLITSLCAGVK